MIDRDWLVKVEVAAAEYDKQYPDQNIEQFVDWIFKAYGYVRTDNPSTNEQYELWQK